MTLHTLINQVLSVTGACFAKVLRWSPIGRTVVIMIEDCVDPWFSDRRVEGIVRAFDPTLSGGPLLIQLKLPLTCYADGAMHSADMVVAIATHRWHPLNDCSLRGRQFGSWMDSHSSSFHLTIPLGPAG